jgi:virulence factor
MIMVFTPSTRSGGCAAARSSGWKAGADPEGMAAVYADGDVKGQCYDTRQVAGSEELYVYGGFKAKHRDFIDAVLSNSDTAGSRFTDCLKTMKVAEQILAQAHGDRAA